MVFANVYFFTYWIVEFLRAKAVTLLKNKFINKCCGGCLRRLIRFRWGFLSGEKKAKIGLAIMDIFNKNYSPEPMKQVEVGKSALNKLYPGQSKKIEINKGSALLDDGISDDTRTHFKTRTISNVLEIPYAGVSGLLNKK